MRFRPLSRGLLLVLLVVLLRPAPPALAQQKAQPKAQSKEARETHAIPIPDAPWTGDFDGMKKRRLIRVLVVYNKTNYFIDRGQPRGITTDAFQLFEEHINKKYKTGNLKIHVALIPVRRDALADLLLSGKGDIVAANIAITPERAAKADFSNPVLKNVSEIVVSGPASQPLASTDDLSGREVFVRKGSIFNESLDKLNDDLKKRGKAPVKLRFAPDNLEDEDLLEMLNAGLVHYVVVFDFLAKFWASVLPKIQLHPEATLRKDADIAWAMRKNSPLLKAELDEFIAKYPEGNATRNMLFEAYNGRHAYFIDRPPCRAPGFGGSSRQLALFIAWHANTRTKSASNRSSTK